MTEQFFVQLESRHELFACMGLGEIELFEVVEEARGEVEVKEVGFLVWRAVWKQRLEGVEKCGSVQVPEFGCESFEQLAEFELCGIHDFKEWEEQHMWEELRFSLLGLFFVYLVFLRVKITIIVENKGFDFECDKVVNEW
jgi:hypothetical protein